MKRNGERISKLLILKIQSEKTSIALVEIELPIHRCPFQTYCWLYELRLFNLPNAVDLIVIWQDRGIRLHHFAINIPPLRIKISPGDQKGACSLLRISFALMPLIL